MQLVLLESTVLPVPQAVLEPPVLLESRVILALLVLPAAQDRTGLLVPPGQRVTREFLVGRVRMAATGDLELMASAVRLDLLGRRARRAVLELLDLPEPWVLLGRMGRLEPLVPRVTLVLLVLLEPPVHLDRLERLD